MIQKKSGIETRAALHGTETDFCDRLNNNNNNKYTYYYYRNKNGNIKRL